jgi:hypothetical protein
VATLALALPGLPAARVAYSVGRIREVSVGCPGTGDVAEAVDRARHYVYQELEGCDHDNGVGFARSVNGGRSYDRAGALPGSNGGWDPWLAVAPDGTLYAAFMNTSGSRTYPIIDVSHNHGRTFRVERSLRPARGRNWGDAEYLAMGRHGRLYVAWDYGPSARKVRSSCSSNGSCWATNGDLNVVVQSSADDARSFTPRSVVNPGYPDGGTDEGDVTVAPDGAIDVLYQGYQIVNRRTLRLAHGHEFLVRSADGGRRWSAPVEVGARGKGWPEPDGRGLGLVLGRRRPEVVGARPRDSGPEERAAHHPGHRGRTGPGLRGLAEQQRPARLRALPAHLLCPCPRRGGRLAVTGGADLAAVRQPPRLPRRHPRHGDVLAGLARAQLGQRRARLARQRLGVRGARPNPLIALEPAPRAVP